MQFIRHLPSSIPFADMAAPNQIVVKTSSLMNISWKFKDPSMLLVQILLLFGAVMASSSMNQTCAQLPRPLNVCWFFSLYSGSVPNSSLLSFGLLLDNFHAQCCETFFLAKLAVASVFCWSRAQWLALSRQSPEQLINELNKKLWHFPQLFHLCIHETLAFFLSTGLCSIFLLYSLFYFRVLFYLCGFLMMMLKLNS